MYLQEGGQSSCDFISPSKFGLQPEGCTAEEAMVAEGDQLLHILCSSPTCPHHICWYSKHLVAETVNIWASFSAKAASRVLAHAWPIRCSPFKSFFVVRIYCGVQQ